MGTVHSQSHSIIMLLFGLLFISVVSARNQGQVVVGGWNGKNKNKAKQSVEIIPRTPSDTCSIPDLPQPRYDHSLSLLSGGRLLVCGGKDNSSNLLDSCLSWVAGNNSRTPLYTMSMARIFHTAWTPPSLPNSIVVLGGWNAGTRENAEIVPGGETFQLEHDGGGACGIPDKDSIVMTGGSGHVSVTRYNIHGFVEELPKLPENRVNHACAVLHATGAFVVVGGSSYQNGWIYLSSVVTLLPGATAWTPLASLPRALAYARASVVGGKLRVTGGNDGFSARSEVLEYHPDPAKEWVKAGDLQQARVRHAALSIGSQELPCLPGENGFPLALVGAAFGGGVLFLALLVSLVVCIAKWKKRRDIRKAPRVDTIDIYGTYDTTGVTSDYNTLLETD